jgi:hypothetical protein
MMRRSSRIGLIGLIAGAATLACQADRERPGPPRLSITIDRDSVQSPDTLTGSFRAQDAEGIDSVWLSVDSAPSIAQDGRLEPNFLAAFRAAIRSGHLPGDRVAVALSARDVSGFTGGLDTFVVVKGP